MTTFEITQIEKISFDCIPRRLYKINDEFLLVGCNPKKMQVLSLVSKTVLDKDIEVEGDLIHSIKGIKKDLVVVRTNK